MVVQLDKISNSSVQMQATQPVSARLPKGISEAPTTLNFASGQKSSKSFMDSVKAFFASIWNFLTCCCRKESKETSADKTASKKEETPVEAATKRVGDFINDQLSSTNLICLTQPVPRIAVIMTLDDKFVDCHFDTLTPQKSLLDFKKTAMQKLEKTVAQQDVKADSKVGIHTVIVEKLGAKSFNVFTWHNSLSSLSTPTETSESRGGGSASVEGVSAGTVAKIVMTHCGNNKQDPKAVALYNSFGKSLKE